VDPTEPSERVLEEARAEIKESVHNSQVKYKRGRGLTLIVAAFLVGALLWGVLVYRSYTTDKSDTALCEKIDRFIVIAEGRVKTSPVLTQIQKDDAVKLYENFRNDPPVCRTN
jgi:hypothetical protein